MIRTVIHFDSGGFYEETENGFKWISKEVYNAITFKTMSLEDITYSVLEERIRKKMGIDEGKKIRMSYIPLSSQAIKHSFILDDEDVESYLFSMNENHLRSILHVEIDNCIDENVRVEVGGSFGVNCDDGDLNAITIYEAEKEHDDMLEIDGVGGDEIIVREELEVTNHDVGSDGCGVNDCFEMPTECYDGEQTQFVEEWEDGMGLELNQEFECKKQVQDIVFIASHKRCFEYDIVNSDTWRYVVRCRQRGCNWYLRVSRPEGCEGSWSVKIYRKMHSCSRVSANTSNARRRGSSDIVSCIVQSNYPGQLNTPSPKSLIGIVQGQVGMKVTYRTALRGKHKTVWVV